MNKRLFLIGTTHTYQYGARNTWRKDAPCTQEAEAAFRVLLKESVTRVEAQGIAEEMNVQFLSEAGKFASVPQLIATELQLPHVFCEPDRCERKALGIAPEDHIRLLAQVNGASEENVERALAKQFQQRESVWVERVNGLGAWPVLFVCGADHVCSFSESLAQAGVECEILHADWQV